MPVLAVDYNLGVSMGQYVKYGDFSGNGQGFESFNDYGFLHLSVVSLSGTEVTLLSTGQFKNGTALPGNGTTAIWDVQVGTQNGTPDTQGPIIASNLNQGDPIPPPNTYSINSTEQRTYLGVSRVVDVLAVAISSPDYNSSLTYVYDKASGMLLEASAQTTIQSQPEPVTSSYSYSVVETNIFGQAPSSTPFVNFSSVTIVLVAVIAVIVVVVVVVWLVLLRKR
ncbi:MAG TPA: hypothetical protein VLH35_04825 [Candidatus Acidoferrales bacterium]|nr:hypothetical protein [Candidatus Acidoferrales bacterium]